MSRGMLLRVFLYALGVAMGTLMSVLLAAYWLDMLSGWSAGLLGGASGMVGVFLREAIADALILSVVSSVLLSVFIVQISGLGVSKRVVVSIAVDLCAGKLVGGVSKEAWNL